MAGGYENGIVDSAKTAQLFALRGGAGVSADNYRAGGRGKGGSFRVEGAPGLYLWVRKTRAGFSVLWKLRLTAGGKETTKTARYSYDGAAVGLTLKEARAWALEIKTAWAKGVDLQREKRAKRDDKRRGLPETVGELFPIWAEGYKTAYSGKGNQNAVLATFTHHAGALTKRRPDDITAYEIAGILSPMANTCPATMKKLRQLLEKFFEWCALDEIGRRAADKANPAAWSALQQRMPNKKTWKKGAPNALCALEDLPRLMRALVARHSMTALALMFQILTASRIENVSRTYNSKAAAPYPVWNDINESAALWTVPAEKMKAESNGVHYVPLSREALHILELARAYGAGRDAVFTTRRGTPVHAAAIRQLLAKISAADEAAGGSGFKDDKGERATTHGIARAGFRTWGREVGGYDRDLLETALHHKRDPLNYDRSTLVEPRREVMQQWASFLFKECPPEWWKA